MFHGNKVRLHPGTVCHLDAPGRPFHLEHCTVQKFDAAKSKWQIRLEAQQWNGKELLVPESSLRLAFCLLPDSVAKRKKMVKLIEEDAQGSCGRGLVVAQSVAPGAPLFEEPPLVLSSSGKGMHQDRWRAYLTLMMSAQQQPAHGAALEAFEDLGISDLPTMLESTKAAASNILSEALAAAGQDLPPVERMRQQEKVTGALMRFQSNQFKFANVEDTGADSGPDDAASRFSAAAVFAFTSRLNHCCSPTAFVSAGKAKFASGTFAEGDGVLLVRAIRALMPGERLTLNYGPAELVTSWPLERRRQYLQERCGFICGCERCVKEEAAQVAEQAAAALAAQAEEAAEKAAAEVLAEEEEEALRKGGAKKKKRNKNKKGKKGGGGGASAGGGGGGGGAGGGAEDGGEEEEETGDAGEVAAAAERDVSDEVSLAAASSDPERSARPEPPDEVPPASLPASPPEAEQTSSCQAPCSEPTSAPATKLSSTSAATALPWFREPWVIITVSVVAAGSLILLARRR